MDKEQKIKLVNFLYGKMKEQKFPCFDKGGQYVYFNEDKTKKCAIGFMVNDSVSNIDFNNKMSITPLLRENDLRTVIKPEFIEEYGITDSISDLSVLARIQCAFNDGFRCRYIQNRNIDSNDLSKMFLDYLEQHYIQVIKDLEDGRL